VQHDFSFRNNFIFLLPYGRLVDNNTFSKMCECTNMGKVKRLELWWKLYVTSLPERDVRNIRPLGFCWTECTLSAGGNGHSRRCRVCCSTMEVTYFCCLSNFSSICVWLPFILEPNALPPLRRSFICLHFFCNTAHSAARLIFNNVVYVTLKQLLVRYCCHPSILRWWYLFHFSAHFVVHLLLL